MVLHHVKGYFFIPTISLHLRMQITIQATALPPNHNPEVVDKAVKNLTDTLVLLGVEIIEIKIDK